MKHFLPFALVLSLLFYSCISATPLPEPTTTPTKTPDPTATATATATETPTPDPKEQIFSQLKSEGISVDTSTGELSLSGVKVPEASIDLNAGDLHIQIGNQSLVITQNEILQRLSVKEGSVVVYDEKGIDSYNNPDMLQWTQVEWAFNPSTTTERWSGWIERAKAIYSLTENNEVIPVNIGDTWSEWDDFVRIQKSFLQPYFDCTFPSTGDMGYDAGNGSVGPFDDSVFKADPSKAPYRTSVNFSILSKNEDEKESRPKDTGIITDQWCNPNSFKDIQTLHEPSNDDSKLRIKDNFAWYGVNFKAQGGYKVPFGYVQKVNFTISRLITLGAFYRLHHPEYLDDKGLTGIHELIEKWLKGGDGNPKGKIPEELQGLWLMEKGIWVK